MPAIFITEVMRLVEYHQIDSYVFTASQSIEQLITKDFSGAHDQWRTGILFAISRQNPDAIRAEFLDELGVLGIRQRFQRRCVPGALLRSEQPPNFFSGDPGFAAARRRRDQNVFELQGS